MARQNSDKDARARGFRARLVLWLVLSVCASVALAAVTTTRLYRSQQSVRCPDDDPFYYIGDAVSVSDTPQPGSSGITLGISLVIAVSIVAAGVAGVCWAKQAWARLTSTRAFRLGLVLRANLLVTGCIGLSVLVAVLLIHRDTTAASSIGGSLCYAPSGSTVTIVSPNPLVILSAGFMISELIAALGVSFAGMVWPFGPKQRLARKADECPSRTPDVAATC